LDAGSPATFPLFFPERSDGGRIQSSGGPAQAGLALEEITMFPIKGRLMAAAALSLAATTAFAQQAKPTDPQIAHIAYTAGQIDIEAADLALKKTHNKAVRSFAEEMARDHAAVNKQALALLKKLNVTPEDNPTSKSLTGAAAAKRDELSRLSGAAFDKAYAQNEVAYHQTVNGALETTLIPNAQNGEPKSLLQTGLKLFQEHQQHAEHLVGQLK
jgi:putative membrane protein